MRVLIAGALGQLGRELTREMSGEAEVLALSSADLDINLPVACLETVLTFQPDVIINAAAYTKVDDCETQLAKAFAVNASGARHLAEAARVVDARYVYISTDYVFDGESRTPYNESDPTNPINVYGRSKLAGEHETRAATPKHYIIRSSWICGAHGANFVKTMLRLAQAKPSLDVVNDQRGCPTFASDLAGAIRTLTRTDCYGTYHVTNEGDCTWFDLATETFRQAGLSCQVLPTTSDRFVRPARRPAYSVLGHAAWDRAGLPPLRPWQEGLRDLVTTLQKGGHEA